MATFTTSDTDLAAVLLAFAGAKLLGIDQSERRAAFSLEVDQARATELRAAWDANTLEGNIHDFSYRRRQLVRALREQAQR